MRIIHGKFQGFRFPPYHGSNTRPTTDLVKESLFNTLSTFLDWQGIKVIDLFAGTGNIGLEFLSRGASEVVSIDHFEGNVKYMSDIKKNLQLKEWTILKLDVIKFIRKTESLDNAGLVFADPPYDLPNIHQMVNEITSTEWFLKQGGIFVLEHVDRLVFNGNHVFLKKQYGNTSFTGFKAVPITNSNE